MLARRKFWWIPFYVLAPAVMLGGLVVWFTVTQALEGREERRLTAEIERASVELKSTGTQIASIKDADLQSMNDYISAYAQIEPLQREYEPEAADYGRTVPRR